MTLSPLQRAFRNTRPLLAVRLPPLVYARQQASSFTSNEEETIGNSPVILKVRSYVTAHEHVSTDSVLGAHMVTVTTKASSGHHDHAAHASAVAVCCGPDDQGGGFLNQSKASHQTAAMSPTSSACRPRPFFLSAKGHGDHMCEMEAERSSRLS